MRYCSCWLSMTNLYQFHSPCCLQSKCHLFTSFKAVSNSIYLNLVLTNCPNETSITNCKFILFLSVVKCVLSYIYIELFGIFLTIPVWLIETLGNHHNCSCCGFSLYMSWELYDSNTPICVNNCGVFYDFRIAYMFFWVLQ